MAFGTPKFGTGFRGYITSTPKSVNFSKKHEKWPNYERSSCMPGPKIGERPYLAPPKTQFWTPILGPKIVYFWSS